MSIEVGDQFGRWRVVRRAGTEWLSGKSRRRWAVRCDCGFKAIVFGRYLTAGKSTGCAPSNGQLAEKSTACRRAWERKHVTRTLRAELLDVLEQHSPSAELVADVEAVLEAHEQNPVVAPGLGATGSDTVRP